MEYFEQYKLEAAWAVFILGYVFLINPIIGDKLYQRNGYIENIVDGFKVHLGLLVIMVFVALILSFVVSCFWLLDYYL